MAVKLLNLFKPTRPEEVEPSMAQRKAVVALGGGGARGLAHLGVMQSIGESGVHTERIVGVSMGSLVGAMCAVDPDILRVQAKAIELLHSPIFQLKQEILFGASPPKDEESSGGAFSWYGRIKKYLNAHRKLTRAVTGPSLISAAPLQESIEHLVPDIDIQDLATPLSIVTVDLLTGQRVVLEKGPLRQAVQASASIPGIFPPVPWGDMLLSDIGVIESIPTVVAQAYASDLTIAVDVGQDCSKITECKTALEVMMRVDDICERLMRRHALTGADMIIRPDVGNIAWFDFSEPERLIAEGRAAGHRGLESFEEQRAKVA
jgi:NTE family protein